MNSYNLNEINFVLKSVFQLSCKTKSTFYKIKKLLGKYSFRTFTKPSQKT